MAHHQSHYSPLTPKLVMQLAAPHTWAASVMPALIATMCACVNHPPISVGTAFLLLVICILMQSSVNTFNDYYDFVKGADSASDNVEITDATLIYNNINPKHALALALGFLASAFLLGMYIIAAVGIVPLVIALIGAVFVVSYSAGKTPISYLPIGELVSGTVMGGLIPLACYYTLTESLDPRMIAWSIPTMVGVALIMLTNNLCDIEKDAYANRKTLPVILGYDKARKLYRALQWLIPGTMFAIVLVWFLKGALVLPFMLVASYPMMKALNDNPLLPTTRIPAMAQVCIINVVFGSFYAAIILASGFPIVA